MTACFPRSALFLCLSIALLSAGNAAAQGPEGSWSSIPVLTARFEHTAIYDPVRRRMIAFGGFGEQSSNEVWSLNLVGPPVWTRLTPSGQLPPPRFGHTAIYDPVRDRMIVFGGHDESEVYGDVWALSLSGDPRWEPLVPTGGIPDARYDHTAVYDPVRDEMIALGGYNGMVLGDAWVLSLSDVPLWTRLDVAGTASMARYRHTAIYDPARDRMIVYGGSDGAGPQGAWMLSLSDPPTWSALATMGVAPTDRARHAAVYDPQGDRMIVFAGTDGSRRNETWALGLADLMWTPLSPGGALPSRRNEPSAIYDEVERRVVVFGGYEETTSPRGDAWALSLDPAPRWTELSPSRGTAPPSWFNESAAYDSRRDRLIVFADWWRGGNDIVDQVHVLSMESDPSWTKLVVEGPAPPARLGASVVYDPVRDRLIVIGGSNLVASEWSVLDDVWALSLGASPRWTRLMVEGPGPRARELASAIYDPRRDRVILFGGVGGAPGSWTDLNDAWSLSLTAAPAWEEIVPAEPTPTPRYAHAGMYDPVRDRMVVFAGQQDIVGSPGGNTETWALDLAGAPRWTRFTPATTPYWAGRSQATIYDPVRDRIVTFLDWGLEVWSLDLNGDRTWERREPLGGPPVFRPTAVYDPVRDRMIVLLGGASPWALTWDQPIRPDVIGPESAKWVDGSTLEVDYLLSNTLDGERVVGWTLGYDSNWPGLPQRGSIPLGASSSASLKLRVPVPAGVSSGSVVLRLSASFAGATGNENRHELSVAIPSSSLGLHGVRPNPVTGPMSAFFTLSSRGHARLEVYDLAGRVVGGIQEMDLEAGHHLVPIARDGLVPGVYVVRLTAGGRHVQAKAVILK